jgi:hypothetical protein
MSRLFPLAEDTDRSLELAKFLAATTGSDADVLAETLKSAVEGGKIAEFLASVLKHQETVVSKATEDGVLIWIRHSPVNSSAVANAIWPSTFLRVPWFGEACHL